MALMCACNAKEAEPAATVPNAVSNVAVPTGATLNPAPRTDDGVLSQIAVTLNFSLGTPSGAWVAPDGKEVLFRRSPPRSFVADLYAYDVASGQERTLVTAQALLGGASENLTQEERARRERQRLVTRGITSFSAAKDGSRLLIPLSGRLFVFERAGESIRELPLPGAALDASLSPDARQVALIVDADLYVGDVSGGAPRRLTRRASDAVENGVAEFVAQEEMGRFRGYWWSPDSQFLAYQSSDLSRVETLHIADAMHPEAPAAAFRYPRVGKANAEVSLGIIPARGGQTLWVRWDNVAFPYLAAVTWDPHAPLTLVVQNRAQTLTKVLAVEAASGAVRELLTEEDAAWINLDSSGRVPRWTPDGQGFLWSTERNGAWELELRDAQGGFVRTLLPGSFGYQALAGLDEGRAAAWVLCSADPRESHVYRVPLDGSVPQRLTEGAASYNVGVNERTGVHVLASRDAQGTLRYAVRRADDSEAGELRSVAEVPPALPRPEQLSVKLGEREHYAAVLRPRDFVAGRRYPVLLSVYGGPHVSVVKLDPYAYLIDQWYADGGFIVVRADGRGTPGRGRAWERAIHKDLVNVALDDQVEILKAVGASHPELDLDRVGIFGWSFGGYLSSMAALLRPDVFRAAVAGAPVTDWRNYDTHYTERYLGLLADDPAPYEAGSAVAHAAKLTRPLLLIHGTTDDNVYFTHSLALSQALFRAGKPFDMLPLAGFTHVVPDPVVKKALSHRIFDFFKRHLGEPSPGR
jgi:dipeptidyl-peptidase-4